MSALHLIREALREARPRRLRGVLEFAETEIVVPDGPHKGERFRASRQPSCRLLYAEIESGRWSRYAITAPSQSGKTLMGWVIPAMWLTLELGETIIVAAPEVQQAREKWRIDLEPAIRASRYRDLLPVVGPGAHGGETQLIQLQNGAAVRFMAGSGDDKSRAAFTARGAFLTETDGMDEVRAGSREADPVTQIEQRTKAYGSRALVIMECTPSIREGRIWREYESGSASSIVCPCPHCGVWVCPERDHLIGWKGTENERAAEDGARWSCPSCAAAITEEARGSMVRAAKLLHRGQEIDAAGEITGPEPGSRTLGFRWNAFHNLMTTPGEIGAREWVVSRMNEERRETEERGLRQFVFAVPAATKAEQTDAREIHILERIDRTAPRGTVPDWCEHLTLGVDVGDRLIHWTLCAWTRTARGHIIDYGIVDTPDGLSVERAILVGLRSIRDRAVAGWPWKGSTRKADLMLVDSGDNTEAVYRFVQERESVGLVMPTKGHGVGQSAGRSYLGPRSTGAVVEQIGDRWHVARLAKTALRLIEFDVDTWKSWLASRTEAPIGGSGAVTLCDGDARTHHAFGAHLRAERRVMAYDPRRGMVAKWQARRAANHWLDSTVLSCLGAGLRGCTPLAESPRPKAEASTDGQATPPARQLGKPPPQRRPQPRSIPRPFRGSML